MPRVLLTITARKWVSFTHKWVSFTRTWGLVYSFNAVPRVLLTITARKIKEKYEQSSWVPRVLLTITASDSESLLLKHWVSFTHKWVSFTPALGLIYSFDAVPRVLSTITA